MLMTDLAPVEAWAAFEEEIYQRFGLQARVYDAKGFTFTGHLTWSNRLCPVIKANHQATQQICSLAHMAMAAEAKAEGGPLIGECDLGLLKICVPVIIDGELIGVAGGCGTLGEDGEMDGFLAEKTAGISESEFEQLTSDVPLMSRRAADEATAWIADRVAAMVAARGNGA